MQRSKHEQTVSKQTNPKQNANNIEAVHRKHVKYNNAIQALMMAWKKLTILHKLVNCEHGLNVSKKRIVMLQMSAFSSIFIPRL